MMSGALPAAISVLRVSYALAFGTISSLRVIPSLLLLL